MARIFAAPVEGHYDLKDVGAGLWVHDLQTALNRAGPGDTVELLPGTYRQPVVVHASGTRDAPITLKPFDAGSPPLLDGGRAPEDAVHAGMEPLDGDFAFLKFVRVAHWRVEKLKFDRCWPSAVFLRAAQDITLADCKAQEGRFFIYARQLASLPTRGITLERCTWIQDPGFDMWEGRATWPEIKASPGFRDKSYLNGAFFGSFNIAGDVIIRDCDIRHAFNAIRMDMDPLPWTPGGAPPPMQHNRNVAIHGNRFSFIRDNAIEPEKGAQNWYVYDNAFYNIHATFSMDRVVKRDVFYFANRILNDRRPGRPGQENQGGKIFKFFKAKEGQAFDLAPRVNFWSLFNSVQTRTSYAKKGATAAWTDYFTLLGLYPENYPEDTSVPRAAFRDMVWQEQNAITGMVCTENGFPAKYDGTVFSGCAGGLRTAFDLNGFEPVPYRALGGWDGQLRPHHTVPGLVSDEVRVRRADGSDLVFPAGLTPGAHDMSAFALSGWPFDGAPPPDGQTRDIA